MEEFSRDEMLYIVAKLSKYYNEQTIEYLKALVNLEISVFDGNEFNDDFKELSDYKKLVFYNLVYRSLEKIKSIENISFDKDKIVVKAKPFQDINISCSQNNDQFMLLYTNYKIGTPLTEKPFVSLNQIDTLRPGSLTTSLRTLSTLRRDLTNEVTKMLLEDWNINYTEQDKMVFTKIYKKQYSWIDVDKVVQ